MNILRISAPKGVRTGMFCKLGSVEDRRPVAVTVFWKLVWMRLPEPMTLVRPST